MTITLKRMFTATIALGMLGVGSAFARSDYNTLPYSQSFENLSAWGNVYTNINITNGWYSDVTTDQSVITNIGPYAFTACAFPLSTAAHTNVLMLNTQGATLTNSFTVNNDGVTGVDMSSQVTYLDTMVKFVSSDTAPSTIATTNDVGVKVAVFANANTNLTIYHGTIETSSGYGHWSGNTNESIAYFMNPTNWYRLTVKFDATCVADLMDPVEMFQIYINGSVVQSSNAYDDTWKTQWPANVVPTLSSTGTWFRSATANSSFRKMLTAVAFQGTGFIDDLVVSQSQPSYTSGYFLTVVNGGNGTSDLGGVNSNPLTQVSVAAGSTTDIVYTATGYNWIQSLTQDGTPVVAAANQTSYTQHLASISAAISNNVSFYLPQWTVYQYVTNGSAPADMSSVLVNNGATYSQTYSGSTAWYELASLTQDGANIDADIHANSQLVTIPTVLGNHSIVANFILPSYSVVANVTGVGGSASVSAGTVNKGDPVTITYSGNPWYRINTLTTNSVTVAGAVGTQYSTTTVAHVVGAIDAEGTFALLADGSNSYGVPTAWLQKWGHDESATPYANTINSFAATMAQQYLLNIDPFISENAGFKVNSIAVTGGSNVSVTVGLQVNSANHTNIIGTLELLATPKLTTAWSPLAGTTVTGDVFTNGVYTYHFVDTVTNDFYKAIIQ